MQNEALETGISLFIMAPSVEPDGSGDFERQVQEDTGNGADFCMGSL
jgi:hypothetical protein